MIRAPLNTIVLAMTALASIVAYVAIVGDRRPPNIAMAVMLLVAPIFAFTWLAGAITALVTRGRASTKTVAIVCGLASAFIVYALWSFTAYPPSDEVRMPAQR